MQVKFGCRRSFLSFYTAWVASGLQNVDGPTAIIEAARFLPDDIFLDLWMPGMDGYEVVAGLRKIPALRHARIVPLTAWHDAATKAKAAAAGFDYHLANPAPVTSIERLIAATVH